MAIESSMPAAEPEPYLEAPFPSVPDEVTPLPEAHHVAEVHEAAEEPEMPEPQPVPREKRMGAEPPDDGRPADL